jgi:hypothetical protein
MQRLSWRGLCSFRPGSFCRGNVCSFSFAYVLPALRTISCLLAERDSAGRTASGNFGLRHSQRVRPLHSMHRVEKVFTLGVDAHAQLFPFAA